MKISTRTKILSVFAILSFLISSFTLQTEIPIAEHYTGGEEQLLKDIQANLKYPAGAKRNRRQGTVIVHAKILENGTLTNVSVVSDKLGAGCGAEAVRIIKTLKFKAPGYIAEYNIPVKFKL
jgi:periplasmic protein TonB